MKYSDLEILRNSKNVCLISHIEPDADALASMVAFKNFLEKFFSVENVCLFAECERVPSICEYIMGNSEINKPSTRNFDVAIMMDSPSSERLGAHKNKFESAKKKIVIDHHNTNRYEGDVNIVEFVSSTCEIILSISKEYKFNLSKQDKEILYAGIITDTNNFSVGNINENTFSLVADIFKDIDHNKIYSQHFSNNTLKNMQMLSIAINNLETFQNNQIIISNIDFNEKEKSQATVDDFTGIINRLATISGSKLVCFIQPRNDEYYVSLRSKPEYDISTIAKAHGGGGHKCAAAYNSKDSLSNIKQEVLNDFIEILK